MNYAPRRCYTELAKYDSYFIEKEEKKKAYYFQVSKFVFFVCFSSLKESTFETWKYVFYFTSKAFSVLKKIKF